MKKPEYKLVAKTKYIQRVAQLAQDIWRECYRKLPRPQLEALLQGQSEEAIDEDMSHNVNYFLVQADGQDVGYFAVALPAGNSAQLRHIYLLPAYRTRGIGRDIIGYAARLAAGDGRSRLCVQIAQRSQESVTFFKRRGFRVVRELAPDCAGQPLPLYELEKAL